MAVFYDNGEGLNLHIAIGIKQASAAVPFPTVPWANQHVALESSLPQWTACMRTRAVHAVKLTFDIANGVDGVSGLDFGDGSWRQFSDCGNFQFWHIYTLEV